jgi:hypothetical protein
MLTAPLQARGPASRMEQMCDAGERKSESGACVLRVDA